MDAWGKLAHTPQRELQGLQNKKLHRFVNRYLYPFSPHYQRLFKENNIDPQKIRTVADLSRIPFTSKQDFFQHGKTEEIREFILQPDQEKFRQFWPASELLKLKWQALRYGPEHFKNKMEEEYRPCFITFTTGTTHHPVAYLYTNHDISNLKIYGARMLNLFDIGSDEHIVNMFPYAPHLAVWQVVFGGLAASVLILSTGGGKVMGTEGNIAAMVKMRPSVILGVPSYVYHVLRAAKQNGTRLDFVKKVVLGASRVTSEFKLRLAELLASMGARDVSVFGTYGFTEARTAWAECPTRNDVSSGYHLYPDKEIFEIIDPKTGEVKQEGEDGEIVYTSIDSRGSSVIRYRTGDFVRGGISYEPCPHCGRTVARLSSDITRISDIKDMQISKVKGSLVNFNHFTSTLSGIEEIEEWQIEMRKKDDDPFEIDQLILYISSRDGVDQTALAEKVRKRVLLNTEVSPNDIKFIPLDEMIQRLQLETSNKEKRIIDRRPES